MRLLNSTTLQLEEFPENEIPKYAILSHTWGKDEISFQDMQTDSAYIKRRDMLRSGSQAHKRSKTVSVISGWIPAASNNVHSDDNPLQKEGPFH